MRRLLLLIATAGALTAAACSSSGGGGNGSLSAQALSDKAIAALQSASAFHVHGSFSDSSGSSTVDLHLGKSGARGSLTVSGQTVQILAAGGQTYFQASDSLYKQFVPADKQATVLPALRGKWVRVPANDASFGDLTSFGSKDKFVAQLLKSSKKCRECKKGSSKTVDGVKAVSFIDQKEHTTVYVSASGTPYPIEVLPGGKGSLHFDSWNQAVNVSPPPASEVIDLSQLTGG